MTLYAVDIVIVGIVLNYSCCQPLISFYWWFRDEHIIYLHVSSYLKVRSLFLAVLYDSFIFFLTLLINVPFENHAQLRYSSRSLSTIILKAWTVCAAQKEGEEVLQIKHSDK